MNSRICSRKKFLLKMKDFGMERDGGQRNFQGEDESKRDFKFFSRFPVKHFCFSLIAWNKRLRTEKGNRTYWLRNCHVNFFSVCQTKEVCEDNFKKMTNNKLIN